MDLLDKRLITFVLKTGLEAHGKDTKNWSDQVKTAKKAAKLFCGLMEE